MFPPYNPSNRAHRIGQTRDVHIYRFIAKNTIEENILKKANQKRHLGNLAIEEGNFNIDGLKEQQLRTLVEVNSVNNDSLLVKIESYLTPFFDGISFEKYSRINSVY